MVKVSHTDVQRWSPKPWMSGGSSPPAPTIRKEKAETMGQSANKPNPADRLMLQESTMSRRFNSATFHKGKLRLNGVGRNPTDVIIWVPEERKR